MVEGRGGGRLLLLLRMRMLWLIVGDGWALAVVERRRGRARVVCGRRGWWWWWWCLLLLLLLLLLLVLSAPCVVLGRRVLEQRGDVHSDDIDDQKTHECRGRRRRRERGRGRGRREEEEGGEGERRRRRRARGRREHEPPKMRIQRSQERARSRSAHSATRAAPGVPPRAGSPPLCVQSSMQTTGWSQARAAKSAAGAEGREGRYLEERAAGCSRAGIGETVLDLRSQIAHTPPRCPSPQFIYIRPSLLPALLPAVDIRAARPVPATRPRRRAHPHPAQHGPGVPAPARARDAIEPPSKNASAGPVTTKITHARTHAHTSHVSISRPAISPSPKNTASPGPCRHQSRHQHTGRLARTAASRLPFASLPHDPLHFLMSITVQDRQPHQPSNCWPKEWSRVAIGVSSVNSWIS